MWSASVPFSLMGESVTSCTVLSDSAAFRGTGQLPQFLLSPDLGVSSSSQKEAEFWITGRGHAFGCVWLLKETEECSSTVVALKTMKVSDNGESMFAFV